MCFLESLRPEELARVGEGFAGDEVALLRRRASPLTPRPRIGAMARMAKPNGDDQPATRGELLKLEARLDVKIGDLGDKITGIGSMLEEVAGHVRAIAEGHGALDAKLTAMANDHGARLERIELEHGARLGRIEHHLGLNGAPPRLRRGAQLAGSCSRLPAVFCSHDAAMMMSPARAPLHGAQAAFTRQRPAVQIKSSFNMSQQDGACSIPGISYG
jgi:hypothetical protein